MWRSMLKVAAATTAFGIAHSALASSSAKRAAGEWMGTRNRNGLYRTFYCGQSLVTLAMLAERVGVTRQTIISLEAGRYAPSLELAFRIAHAFGVGVEDVFRWEGKR